MEAGRAKTPGGGPGENGSQRGSAGCCGAKYSRRAIAAPGGEKSRKRTAAGGQPRTLGCAGGAVGSEQGLSLRVDTFSSLSPMRSVKWCREGQMTAQVSSYSGWSGGTWPSRLTNTVGARVRSLGSCGSGRGAAAVLCLVEVGSAAFSVQCFRKLLKKIF